MSEQRQTTEEVRPESQRRGVYDWFVSLFSDEPETRAELLEMLRDAAERQLVDGQVGQEVARKVKCVASSTRTRRC